VFTGCLVIVAIWDSKNHNHESCIWQLEDITSRDFARALTQILRWSLVTLLSLLLHLQSLTCTFLQKHPHPLPPNPFGIIEIFPKAATSQKSPKNLHLASPSAGVHLASVSKSSVLV
jgi:hypothetical protein